MQAIGIQNGCLRFVADAPGPTPAEGEVIVDVLKAGICETDLQLSRGYMGFAGILGHEFVGVATSGSHKGKRVVGEINCNCRQCPRCHRGLGNHCDRRTVIGIHQHDGAFAQRVAVPEHNLHLVPDGVSDDQAVFVEPLAAAFQIIDQVDLKESDHVAVLGDGRLGFLSAQVLRLTCANVTVVGKHQQKLNRFSAIGCTTSLVDQPLEAKSFDVVVDCTGSESGLLAAMDLVRPRGTIVLKTTVAATHQLSLAPIVIDEITVVGSRCGPFERAIEALVDQSISVADLVSHRYPLSEASAAFAAAVDPSAFKVVFEIGVAQAD